MKENKKQTKGITLIALVITIIVLLILAGVSIAMLTGQNGILTQAQNASKKTGKASIIEQAKLDILEKQTDETTIYKGDIKNILDKYFEGVTDNFILDTELQTKPEYGDYQIKVSEIYNGELVESPKILGDILKNEDPFIKYNGMLCKVLYNDDTHGLQIVTMDNVDNVTLGSSSFDDAMASYNNVVDILNNKAKEYMGTKAIDARSLGSIATLENGKFQGDISEMFTGTYNYLETYDWNGKFKAQSSYNYEDMDQINSLRLDTATSETWIAGRMIYSYSKGTMFNVRYSDDSGNTMLSDTICTVFSSGSKSGSSKTRGIRPGFLVSPDTVISSGDGSEENPYII